MNKNWHSKDVKRILEELNSSLNGLTSQEIKNFQLKFGQNLIPDSKIKPWYKLVLHQFLSPLIYLLFIAAIVSIIIGEYSDAVVILVVVLLNGIIGFFQESKAEQSIAALRQLTKTKARVKRDNLEIEISAVDLVPGDIIILNAGDAVPSDARLIEVSSLAVAEAALTGESVPVFKNVDLLKEECVLAERFNMIYAGTFVTAGRCIAVVTSIGQENEVGKIAHMASNTVQPKTNLEQSIAKFGKWLSFIAFILFFIIVFIGYLKSIPFNQIFMIAISQMVSLVPEGLPVAITIALAVGVQRMAKKGTVVRNLAAVETLGSTTIICTDKTGTLTKNEMTVTEVFLANGRKFQVSGIGYNPEGQIFENGQSINLDDDQNFKLLLECGVLCNDSKLNFKNNSWQVIGDPTESALLTLAAKNKIDIDQLKMNQPRIAEIPFDAKIKYMATEHLINGEKIIYLKGAPEAIIKLTSEVYNIGKIDNQKLLAIQEAEKEMASKALRILAFGCIFKKDLNLENLADHVVFLGLLGQIDPPREEVASSVQACKKAGIKPVMVTGDHKITGLAIATSLGISSPGDMAIDGKELDSINDEELTKKINQISVFARVHPEQKLRIVKAYQNIGHTVAMTGDGVNDAPALVQANVGVAMGITGTEVAKEASKIIITDDNFATIISAVAEGRLVYQNIKKLILFLFVTSIDEVIILFLAILCGYPPPLAAVQVLWINLVTEGTLTVNLIMEPAEGDEMNRMPLAKNHPLIDGEIIKRLPSMIITSVIATFGWFVYRTHMGVNDQLVQTETFTMLAVCQWYNVLNCRSASQSVFSLSILKNVWLIAGLVLGNILHFLVIYWEPLSKFFRTVPIDFSHFLLIGLIASSVLWVEEIRKIMIRQKIK